MVGACQAACAPGPRWRRTRRRRPPERGRARWCESERTVRRVARSERRAGADVHRQGGRPMAAKTLTPVPLRLKQYDVASCRTSRDGCRAGMTDLNADEPGQPDRRHDRADRGATPSRCRSTWQRLLQRPTRYTSASVNVERSNGCARHFKRTLRESVELYRQTTPAGASVMRQPQDAASSTDLSGFLLGPWVTSYLAH